MLIDFHTHAFPDKIAANAMAKLTHAYSGILPQTDGSLSSLKAQLAIDGVDIAVVQSIATNPTQQTNVNNFAIEINQDDAIIAFGSIHPDAPNALEELERIKDAGLKGVKFHPEFQLFYPDEERMKPIYKKISSLGLITLFHAGNDPAFLPPYKATPEHMQQALKWFDSPVVAAHWGGLGCCSEVLDKLCGENIWFDVSFGYTTISKTGAQKIIEKHGVDKLLFGSDMPWHRPSWELQLVQSLDISDADMEKICCKNAQKLLHI